MIIQNQYNFQFINFINKVRNMQNISPSNPKFSPSPHSKQIPEETNQKCLKSAILSKLATASSSKNKYKQAEAATTSKQRSSIKKISKNLFVENKLALDHNKLIPSLEESGFDQMISPHPHPYLYEKEQLEKDVLELQSQVTPGFYQYKNWQQFHQKFYDYVEKASQEELWKILRIVNYGQVHIPSGLIFDLHYYFKHQSKANQNLNLNLKEILNNFLSNNNVKDRLRNFRELNNYTSLQDIEAKYLPTTKLPCKKRPSSSKELLIHYKTDPKEDKYNSVRKYRNSFGNENVWNRNFKDAMRREQSKVTVLCENVVRQQSQCKFKPQTHEKPSLKYSTKDQSKKIQRVCHHKEKYKTSEESSIAHDKLGLQNLLKAKNISIDEFEGGLQSIPGVGLHLHRNLSSQANKLKLQRELQKPNHSKKSSYSSKYIEKKAKKSQELVSS